MNLKEARLKRGWSKYDAAERFGLTFRAWQNYENGYSTPKLKRAYEIAQEFGCTIGELFDLVEDAAWIPTDAEKKLLNICEPLNDEGVEKLADYAKLLTGSCKYLKEPAKGKKEPLDG